MYAKKVREFSQACSESVDLDKKAPKKLDARQIAFICEMLRDETEELQIAESLVDQADAFADLIYYILDTCNKNGIDLDPIFDIVHQANMRKVVDGKVLCREDGKILKPAGWRAPEPEIEKEINRQQERGAE